MNPKQLKLLQVNKRMMILMIVIWAVSLLATGIYELFDPSDMISGTFLVFWAGVPLAIIELICLGLYKGAKNSVNHFNGFAYTLLALLSVIYAIATLPFVISFFTLLFGSLK